MRVVEFAIPIRTVSEANKSLASRHGFHAKKRRVASQRAAVRAGWIAAGHGNTDPVLFVPGRVLLTRVAPRGLDDDNLRGALKAVRDGVAKILGIDDRDPRVAWDYEQARGPKGVYAVQIRIRAGLGAVEEWRAIPDEERAAVIQEARGADRANARAWRLAADVLDAVASRGGA